MRDIILDGDRFIYFKGYWVGENGEILNSNHKVLKSFPTLKIDGKNYRKANLIADLWIGKPSDKANLKYKDGNNKNCALSNLEYSTKITRKEYKQKVIKLTELQPLHLLKDFVNRDYNKYHVDHIIPISVGYKLGIPEEEIADIANLQVLTKEENLTKGNLAYCVIDQCLHIKKLYAAR